MQRKIFRVEQMPVSGRPSPSAAAGGTQPRHFELLNELKSLRALAERGGEPGGADMAKLRQELALIYEAISRTKRELSTLVDDGHEGSRVARAAHELDAVVGGTEKATQKILQAAENIDENAKTLAAAVKNAHEKGLAQDIQDHVLGIYEACNFQDLAGQRISKVMVTLQFIEQHVVRMMDIWSGIDQAKILAAAAPMRRAGDKFVNGPKLDGDAGHASQRDIDTIFN